MTEPFLAQVARYYYEAYGDAISELRFVFPSKRALTFFRHYLGRIASDRPIFAPRMETIGDFIGSLRPSVQLLDKTALLFELYEAYRSVREERGEAIDSFDAFLYWGGLILKDFDSCDRYLVPIHHLYGNLRDLKELTDDFSYLSPEDREAIRSVWGKLPALDTLPEDEADAHKARFLSFWESLSPLYERFNARLDAAGLTYEGQLYRQVAEAKEELIDELDESELIFVGLFQLTPSELRIFEVLRKAGRGQFCWDSQVAVVQDKLHPASSAYTELVRKLGQVPGPWTDASSRAPLPQCVEVIQAPSLLAQVKGLPAIFSSLGIQEQAERLQAALVLPDEGLLLPTASSIPEDTGAVNITLGYPLDKTPIALLLRRWVSLLEFGQRPGKGGRYPADQLLGLLGHRLITEHSSRAVEAMKRIRKQKRFFVPVEVLWRDNEDELLHLLLDPMVRGDQLLDRIERLLRYFIDQLPSALLREEAEEAEPDLFAEEEARAEAASPLSSFDIEFIHHYLRLVTRLRGLVTPYLANLELGSVVHLLDGLVSTVTIPFEGDPLEGLQVMGLLETRLLHFDTLVYLSAQEGSLPSSRFTDTLIPFTLRRAFRLPVGGDDDLGADYTFFQSIAQASRLVFIVAPASEASALGEESRYIRMLEYVYGCPVKRTTLRFTSDLQPFHERVIPKEGESWEAFVQRSTTDPAIKESKGRALSPSSLAKYVQCPLSFYYAHVLGLKEEEEPSLLLASNSLGNIVHDALDELYKLLAPSHLPEEAPLSVRLSQGTIVEPEHIDLLLKQKGAIRRQVETSYRKELGLDATPLSNLGQLYCDTIEKYVRAILEADLRAAPFEYICSEKRVTTAFRLPSGREVFVGGIIDRIDKQAGSYRIVDYKTGSASLGITRWEQLLQKNHKAVLQTLIYAEVYQSKVLDQLPHGGGASELYTAIYRFAADEGLLKTGASYDPIVKLPKEDSVPPEKKARKAQRPYAEVRSVFTEFFTTEILAQLFDETEPFRQTPDEKNCSYCPFALSCGRTPTKY